MQKKCKKVAKKRRGHRDGKPSHLEISAEPCFFTFFCRGYTPFHLVPMLPFMCEHNTKSYELTGFFKKCKKCKKVAKKFGKGKMFDVPLSSNAAVKAASDSRGALTPSNVHRTFSVRLNRFSLSSRISLVSRSCFAGSKTGIKFRANKRRKQRHIMPENKHTLLTRSPKLGRYKVETMREITKPNFNYE